MHEALPHVDASEHERALYERWVYDERAALTRLLANGTFLEIHPPFDRSPRGLDLQPPRHMRFSYRAELLLPPGPRPRAFDKCDLRMNRFTSGEEMGEYLRHFAVDHAAQPVSFRHLVDRVDWKSFAGNGGNVPRLLLPGVLIVVNERPFFPVIDYLRPEHTDGESLAFLLRAISLDHLRFTGARALFLRSTFEEWTPSQ